MNKKIHILGGGTVQHIRNHFSVCAPAYGSTAKLLYKIIEENKLAPDMDVKLVLTKMAGGQHLETNSEVEDYIKMITSDPRSKIVFFNMALCDYDPEKLVTSTKESTVFDKYHSRLETKEDDYILLHLRAADKIIKQVREVRKDIFLVGFKTTCGSNSQDMFTRGLRLLKNSGCNLVLVNDTFYRHNMIVTPEEAAYCETGDRNKVLKELVEMAVLRSQLTFTQSTVVAGQPVPWSSPEVPDSLRKVVDYCISKNAYKAFNGATVGHFACKISDTEFLTSVRKSNFNELSKNGLVRVTTDGPDTVLAYGAKPSVGGQSQRIVFKEHEGMDCIVHFHCPLKHKHKDVIPVASQREYECGSHQCGQNTSGNLKQFGNLKAVMLDRHGPNIVFNRKIDPNEVIKFIEDNFDLEQKTGGYTV